MWNLDPPPGFQGLHPDKPVTMYFRHLPHWRQDGAMYFVTFRLSDSLPNNKLNELRGLKAQWEPQRASPDSTAAVERRTREIMQKVETWLDQGMGSCHLRDHRATKIVTEAMRHFDKVRYELCCHVVMPNHVHVVVRPLEPQSHSLEQILQSWKRFTARRINSLLGMAGPLWQQESFDRIIRDEEHLYRAIQYIGRNPVNAGLERDLCRLWIKPSWERIGWKFEEPQS